MFEKIMKLCEERKISISMLEKECGFGNATIRKWEKSKPSVDNLAKVARFFGVDLNYFMND